MNNSYEYDVALSFTGEDRQYVEEVALLLKGYGVRVFYDKFEEDKLWGKNLYDYLSDVYTKRAKYTIMFISKHYKEKLWTNHERESMQERAFQSSREYILPVRFDDTEIPGIRSTTGYLDINGKEPSYLVGVTLRKIGWTLHERWWGRWEVESVTSAYSGLLEIYEVTQHGFTFELTTLHGAHTGEIQGVANFVSKNEASYSSDTAHDGLCKLTFHKTNDSIQVSEGDGCRSFHGMRAFFSGDYRLSKDSFYERVMVSDINLTAIYKMLGKERWAYYSNCFSDIHKLYSLDGPGIEAISGGMPGLYTICKSILMIKDEAIWGAFIDDDKVYYFTNTGQGELPATILDWKGRFNEKEVVLLAG